MLSSSTFVNTTSVINQGCCEENEMTCAAAAFCAFALYYDMIKEETCFKVARGFMGELKVNEHGVTDLIGRVVSITEPKVIQFNQKPPRLIDFVIEESRNYVLQMDAKSVESHFSTPNPGEE
nr:uncharacterized protein LOC109185225 [Ipomoea batatas]